MNIDTICKALSDSSRLQIIQMISGQEKCACDLLEEFDFSQPTLSHHMKILTECQLVIVRKQGKWNYYSLNCEALKEFKSFFEQLSCLKESSTCSCQ